MLTVLGNIVFVILDIIALWVIGITLRNIANKIKKYYIILIGWFIGITVFGIALGINFTWKHLGYLLIYFIIVEILLVIIYIIAASVKKYAFIKYITIIVVAVFIIEYFNLGIISVLKFLGVIIVLYVLIRIIRVIINNIKEYNIEKAIRNKTEKQYNSLVASKVFVLDAPDPNNIEDVTIYNNIIDKIRNGINNGEFINIKFRKKSNDLYIVANIKS